MTGRDLILYILDNKLENEEVFKDGKLIGFMSVPECAVKFGVGIDTVKTWVELKILRGYKIGNEFYIPIIAKLEDLM